MRSATEYLSDILVAIDSVSEFIADGRDSYLQDFKTQCAVMYLLEVIGEAAASLPRSIKEQYSEVDWARLTRTRNRLVHAYFTARQDIVFKEASRLPRLRPEIEVILKSLTQ